MFGFIILIKKNLIDKAWKKHYFKMYYRTNKDRIDIQRKKIYTAERRLKKKIYNYNYNIKNKERRALVQGRYYYHNKSIFGNFCRMCSNLYYI
tara:strand:- start:4 stop:282 length:279 start_codon:yes stop_codon:yes gene_type:complete